MKANVSTHALIKVLIKNQNISKSGYCDIKEKNHRKRTILKQIRKAKEIIYQ